MSALSSSLSPGIAIALLPYVGISSLKPAAQLRKTEIDREINHCANDIERQWLVDAADDLLDRHHEIDDAHQRNERASLHRVGDVVDPLWKEAADSLWKDHIEHPPPESEPDGFPRLDLAEVNGLERAAHDL